MVRWVEMMIGHTPSDSSEEHQVALALAEAMERRIDTLELRLSLIEMRLGFTPGADKQVVSVDT